MTIKNSWGKLISAGGFAGAGVFSLIRYICCSIAIHSWGGFWSSCVGICSELVTICLLAALAGYLLIYLATKENFDLIICAGIAGAMLLHIVTNNSSLTFWGIVWGLCCTVYLAIMALRAKDENKMVLVILLGCAALYSILGNWLTGIMFFQSYSTGLMTFGFLVRAVLSAASFAIAGVHIYTSDTIESNLSAAAAPESANTAVSDDD